MSDLGSSALARLRRLLCPSLGLLLLLMALAPALGVVQETPGPRLRRPPSSC
ncbi:MAG: hypothetical protein HY683_00660 [Chloroflexi bacterium]|nr:hypothetical protein [Chloroflexota bacterium]